MKIKDKVFGFLLPFLLFTQQPTYPRTSIDYIFLKKEKTRMYNIRDKDEPIKIIVESGLDYIDIRIKYETEKNLSKIKGIDDLMKVKPLYFDYSRSKIFLFLPEVIKIKNIEGEVLVYDYLDKKISERKIRLFSPLEKEITDILEETFEDLLLSFLPEIIVEPVKKLKEWKEEREEKKKKEFLENLAKDKHISEINLRYTDYPRYSYECDMERRIRINLEIPPELKDFGIYGKGGLYYEFYFSKRYSSFSPITEIKDTMTIYYKF